MESFHTFPPQTLTKSSLLGSLATLLSPPELMTLIEEERKISHKTHIAVCKWAVHLIFSKLSNILGVMAAKPFTFDLLPDFTIGVWLPSLPKIPVHLLSDPSRNQLSSLLKCDGC
ncbi:predicted protein [Histoplasma capsulatum H143]|uniref:Uncharacterized protein n=1 Tax=Ajellomyces capsulatus (strain H143) TaxID=544712 RepID=C6H9Y2_AJECH|nr:predicted protein [Histoplasma capsulatum H143]